MAKEPKVILVTHSFERLFIRAVGRKPTKAARRRIWSIDSFQPDPYRAITVLGKLAATHPHFRIRISSIRKMRRMALRAKRQIIDATLFGQLVRTACRDPHSAVRIAAFVTIDDIVDRQPRLVTAKHIEQFARKASLDPAPKSRKAARFTLITCLEKRKDLNARSPEQFPHIPDASHSNPFLSVTKLSLPVTEPMRDWLRGVLNKAKISTAEFANAILIDSLEKDPLIVERDITASTINNIINGKTTSINWLQWHRVMNIADLGAELPHYARQSAKRNFIILHGSSQEEDKGIDKEKDITRGRLLNGLKGRGGIFYQISRSAVPYEVEHQLRKAKSTGLPTTVIVNTHGRVYHKNGLHYLSFRSRNDMYTCDLFRLCKQIFKKKPLDIFIMSCESGGAVNHANTLPRGSVVVSLCSEKGDVYYADIKALFAGLCRSKSRDMDLNAFNLLDSFLASARYAEWPVIARSGGKKIDSRSFAK